MAPKAGENPRGFVDAALPFLHGLGCRVWSPERARARSELLRLHAEAIRFHLEDDVDGWLERERSVQLMAGRGQLFFPTAAERRGMREGYLGSTTFSVYRDLVPPVVRLADDLSQGWLMAQVEVAGTQRTEAGQEMFSSVWAWIELFERGEDGTWLWVGNVSNAQPEPRQAPAADAASLEALRTETWKCRNDLELSCAKGACEVEPEGTFTPMDVYADTSGALNVCAYSGCWEGVGRVLGDDRFLVLIGRDLELSPLRDRKRGPTSSLRSTGRTESRRSRQGASLTRCCASGSRSHREISGDSHTLHPATLTGRICQPFSAKGSW